MPYMTRFSTDAQGESALRVGEATIAVSWSPQGTVTVIVDAPYEVSIDWVPLPENMKKADREVRSADVY